MPRGIWAFYSALGFTMSSSFVIGCRDHEADVAKCAYLHPQAATALGRCLVERYDWHPQDVHVVVQDVAATIREDDSLAALLAASPPLPTEPDSLRRRRNNPLFFGKSDVQIQADQAACVTRGGEYVAMRACLINRRWPTRMAEDTAQAAALAPTRQRRKWILVE